MALPRIFARLIPAPLRQQKIVRRMPFRLVAAFGDHDTYTAGQVRRILRDLHVGKESERFALALACSQEDYLAAVPGGTPATYRALRLQMASRFNLPDEPFTMRQLSRKGAKQYWEPLAETSGV